MSLKFHHRIASFSLAALALLAAPSAIFAAHPQVEFTTPLGTFVVELYEDKAPITVKNFIDYVESGHYVGTAFHRSIVNFIVQGGGYTIALDEKPTRDPIRLESNNGLKNSRRTLAMARTDEPDSARSQFFVNMGDNSSLDYTGPSNPGYAVFGRIIKGFDTVARISQLPTTSIASFTDVPGKPVLVQSNRVLSESQLVQPEEEFTPISAQSIIK